MNTEIQEILRVIRKEFFAFRNGIVADKLRKAGDPHGMIMGCLLVDIAAIAGRVQEAIKDIDPRKDNVVADIGPAVEECAVKTALTDIIGCFLP